MRRTVVIVAILALLASGTPARLAVLEHRDIWLPGPDVDILWFGDIESGAPGWTSGSFVTPVLPQFHVDACLAYGGEYSWWCGTFG